MNTKKDKARIAQEEILGAKKLYKREYTDQTRELRWKVLTYSYEHSDLSLSEVAQLFGIKEHTIRAWKAHLTMGTYEKKKQKQREELEARWERYINESQTPKPLVKNKKGFIERKRSSKFIHYFDQTPAGIICPHFYILAFANGCPFQCEYCYLYLTLRHYPEPTVFSNTARMYQEVREWLRYTEEPSVLNTGEVADSLAWDRQVRLSENLIPLFADQTKHKLLFLTKSTVISGLKKIEPNPQVIVSFSLNADKVARLYEHRAPPVALRLKSASELKRLGYKIRIRIDPIIPIDNWKMEYLPLIDKVNELEPETVTLGSLRFFPNLLNYARYGKDVFKYACDNHDPDGRFRIPYEQRLEIYQYFIFQLPARRLGLCKETETLHKQLCLNGVNQNCNCSYD